MQKRKSHLAYYIFLTIILGAGLLGAYLSSPNRQLQMAIVVLTTLSYVAFGILHHFLNHDLNTKIVIEYTLIGSLGLSLVFFLMKGGLGI